MCNSWFWCAHSPSARLIFLFLVSFIWSFPRMYFDEASVKPCELVTRSQMWDWEIAFKVRSFGCGWHGSLISAPLVAASLFGLLTKCSEKSVSLPFLFWVLPCTVGELQFKKVALERNLFTLILSSRHWNLIFKTDVLDLVPVRSTPNNIFISFIFKLVNRTLRLSMEQNKHINTILISWTVQSPKSKTFSKDHQTVKHHRYRSVQMY